jgi:hypothetical protein
MFYTARTYAYASNLPPFLLDALLNLPYILLSIRNALIPIQPYIRDPPRSKPTSTQPAPAARKLIEAGPESSPSESGKSEASAHGHHEGPSSDIETGSEADVESNTEHDSGAEHDSGTESGTASMANSWVDVQS